MAKGGRRSKSKGGKNGQHRHEDNHHNNSQSDDELSNHDGSVTSYQSSRMIDGYNSNEEDNGIDVGHEDSVYVDDFEDKLIEFIDSMSDTSSLKGRIVIYNSIIKSFTSRYLYDFVQDRKITIMDMIERSLKRPKGSEEVGSAALLAALTCITLGPSDETDMLMREVKDILITLSNDATVPALTKSKIVTALGVITFITDDGTSSAIVMDSMVTIFSGSFLKGNGVVPSVHPQTSSLHASALNTWTLLLTTCTIDTVLQLSDKWSSKISELLNSPDVELRMSAGETLATIQEMLVHWNSDFELDNCDELLDKLKSLATDSSKHRAKRDRRVQRSTFREVVKTIEGSDEEGGSGIYEVVKFGRERLIIESWCKKRQYDSFCYILGPGMNLHLSLNDLLRDIFGLGEPIIDGINGSNGLGKVSKFERHMENLAIARARTKVRGKLRDKRNDTELIAAAGIE